MRDASNDIDAVWNLFCFFVFSVYMIVILHKLDKILEALEEPKPKEKSGAQEASAKEKP